MVAHEALPGVSMMFLPHFDVFCDLLLYMHIPATWKLFFFYLITKQSVVSRDVIDSSVLQ